LESVGDTLVAINMPNGAHHSDLTHTPASPTDTADIKAGRQKVERPLGVWLDALRTAK